jgi:hypothetical protein
VDFSLYFLKGQPHEMKISLNGLKIKRGRQLKQFTIERADNKTRVQNGFLEAKSIFREDDQKI